MLLYRVPLTRAHVRYAESIVSIPACDVHRGQSGTIDNMIEQLLGTVLEGPTLLEFVRNMAIGALLALGLERVYIRYGHSLSNRTMFARHFYLLAMTTTLIITVVQSSLTLSLGLIGALSIVRFPRGHQGTGGTGLHFSRGRHGTRPRRQSAHRDGRRVSDHHRHHLAQAPILGW